MREFSTAYRLKQLMDERGLRQVDILKMCEPYCEKYDVKLGKNDLSQYVSGKVEPRQHKLSVLGMALNVSEAWLMGFDTPMERAPQSASAAIPTNTIQIINRDGSVFEKHLSDEQIDIIRRMIDQMPDVDDG